MYDFPMATVTKTIHQLPFDQLEPKRFEDLIRVTVTGLNLRSVRVG